MRIKLVHPKTCVKTACLQSTNHKSSCRFEGPEQVQPWFTTPQVTPREFPVQQIHATVPAEVGIGKRFLRCLETGASAADAPWFMQLLAV